MPSTLFPECLRNATSLPYVLPSTVTPKFYLRRYIPFLKRPVLQIFRPFLALIVRVRNCDSNYIDKRSLLSMRFKLNIDLAVSSYRIHHRCAIGNVCTSEHVRSSLYRVPIIGMLHLVYCKFKKLVDSHDALAPSLTLILVLDSACAFPLACNQLIHYFLRILAFFRYIFSISWTVSLHISFDDGAFALITRSPTSYKPRYTPHEHASK